MDELDTMLKENNPYARSYKMMHEVEKEELEKCKGKKTLNKVKTVFTRNELANGRRYYVPAQNEVAIVFTSEDGTPPVEWDICIYSKNDKPINIPLKSILVDSFTYPLMFPTGGFGWKPGMKS